MPQLVPSSENESCLTSVPGVTGDGCLVLNRSTNNHHSNQTSKSYFQTPFESSQVIRKESDFLSFGYIDKELKCSPDISTLDVHSSENFLSKESWSTCYASHLRDSAWSVSSQQSIDVLVDKLFGEDQKKQFLSMKSKDKKMGERKERLKCVGIDPTYRAFMDDEKSLSSQDVKKGDQKNILQDTLPQRNSPESQLFPNRELAKVLDSASSRFSNFFTNVSADSGTLVPNEVRELSDGVFGKLDENATSKNIQFDESVVAINLESNEQSSQQQIIEPNEDKDAALEHLTRDEISNSLEKIFTENTSVDHVNMFNLKEGQEAEIEFVFESDNLTLPENTSVVQSDNSNIVDISQAENIQTIEIIVDQTELPMDGSFSTCEDVSHTISVQSTLEGIGEPSIEKEEETEVPVEYVISMESDSTLTVPEVTSHSSIETSECLYTELDTHNEVITYVNVPVSEINALNQRFEADTIQKANSDYQSDYKIQENVLYNEQQNTDNLNDETAVVTETDGQTFVETKRDIISEAYIEAMKGCIELSDGGMLEECATEVDTFGNHEMVHQSESQFMEVSDNSVTRLQSPVNTDDPCKNHPSREEEMEISSEDFLIVPKARKSLPSTPIKSTGLERKQTDIDNLLASKLDISGSDFFNDKVENGSNITGDDQKSNPSSPLSSSIADSHPVGKKSTARKSIRGNSAKSSSLSYSGSSDDDAYPNKRRKLEGQSTSDATVGAYPRTPTTAMKTFVKPFTVAKKSVAEQTAYKTVLQALGVKTAMKTVKPPKTNKDNEGKAMIVSLNDNELTIDEMSPDDSKITPLCWSPMKELIPQKDVCRCSAKKLPCILNGETLQSICEAEDSIDGETVPCKKQVTQQYLSTPSSVIKYKALCDVHVWRLQQHHCCSKCGLFCTQGCFLLCSSSNPMRSSKESHFFHPDCLLVPGVGLPPSCPHCCKFSEFKNIKLVLLDTENSSHNSTKNPDTKSITNGLENYTILMQTINPEPKKPLNGSFTSVSQKQELQSMVMAIAGEKSLHLRPAGKCLLNPVKNGDVKKVLQLIVNGVNPNHKFKTHKNNTPLHIGAYYGFTGIVSVLLQYGADMDALNDDLETPLILAVERNQFAVVRYLVFAGAQVNAKNENGLNAFHVAAKKGSKEIGEFLYNTGKFDVNIQDDGGWTPLVWACEKGFSDYIEWLLELGADPNVRDNEENTALHWAACTGDSNILTMFLDHGCNLTFVNQRGDSALHVAARKDNSSCVKLLLKRDAPVDVKNKEGETPLQCCDMGTKSLRMLKRHVSNVLRMEKVPLLHNVVYRDISRGAESFPIQAVNEVDGEEFIMDFRYVIRNCYASGLRIVATVDSMKVCYCKDNCSSNDCTCIKLSKCWYDMNGLLSSDFDLSDPPSIYECNKTCHCPKTCINRIVQLGLKIPLQIFRTLTMGWGVRTLKELPKGTFVCEYIGEVLDGKEVDEREEDCYLFNLESKTGDVCLDGRFYGNVARFINHSCDPNLVCVRVFIEHQDVNFPRIAFFTSRNVEAYEELCFDYGIDFWIAKSQTTLCTCNTSSCKYSKDSIDDTLQSYADQKLGTT